MSELKREHLTRPWWLRRLDDLTRASRPLRRRVAPNRFKETYVNRALAGYERPTLYLEIGVREGESFRLALADRKIAVDPERMPRMAQLESGEQFFEMMSDEFFDQRAPAVLEPESVHVALIDGLHEFRQVLHDLTNLERYMRRNGVVILDDCNPRNAKRGSDEPIGGAWNGDVWKVQAYLLVERRDLEVATIDADQGIGVVTGFQGVSSPWDEVVVEAYKALPYEYLAADRARVLNLLPSSRFDSLLPQREE